ncbi:30460_t:CDS:1, partial [Racocetra persica]
MEIFEALEKGNHDSYNSNSCELIQYFDKLDSYIEDANLKRFESSEFSDLKQIDRGGTAVVFSANYQGKKYALKSLNIHLLVDDRSFKDIKRE